MKKIAKIIIICVVIISIIWFLWSPSFFGQPECRYEIVFVDYKLQSNWDWIYCNITMGEVIGEEFRNQTHIFDINSDTWKIDKNYDTVNTKSCPQFCPKEKSDADRAKMVELGYELTGSLALVNESRDSMLAQGYELYPGGWLHKDRIKADPVWVEHPNGSGELILDGNAMKIQYDKLVKAKELMESRNEN